MNKEIKEVLKSLRKLNKNVTFKVEGNKIISSEAASRLFLSDGYYIHDGVIMKGDYQVGLFEHKKDLVNEEELFHDSDSIGSVEEIDNILGKINSNKSEIEENKDNSAELSGPKVLPNQGTYVMPKKEETTEKEENNNTEEKKEVEESAEKENTNEIKIEKKHVFRNLVRRVFNPVRLAVANFLEKNKESFVFDSKKYFIHDQNLKISGNGINEPDKKVKIIEEISDLVSSTGKLFNDNKDSISSSQSKDIYDLIKRYNELRGNIKEHSLEDFVNLKIDIEKNHSDLESYLSDIKAESVSKKIDELVPSADNKKKESVESMTENIDNKKYEIVENKINKIEFELSKDKKLKNLFGKEFEALRNRFDIISESFENGNASEKDSKELERINNASDMFLNSIKKEKDRLEEPVVEDNKEMSVETALNNIKTNNVETPKAIVMPKAFETSSAVKAKESVKEEVSTIEVEEPKTVKVKLSKAIDKLPELERKLEEAKVSLEVCEEVDKEYFKEKKEKIEKLINDIKTAERRTKVEEYAKKTVYAREAEALVEKQEAEKREDSRRALEASNEFYRNDYISYWEGLSDDDLSPYSNVPAKKLDEVLDIKSKIRELQKRKNEILAGRSIDDESISDKDYIDLRHVNIDLKKYNNKEVEVINREEPTPIKEEYIWNTNTRHFIKK